LIFLNSQSSIRASNQQRVSRVLGQPALLDMPLRVAVDAQNNVFVTEVSAMRIAKFNASGDESLANSTSILLAEHRRN
jgi:hypothetical protein